MLAATQLAGFAALRLLPIIVASATTSTTGASSTAVPMPSGIKVGDLLIGFFGHNNAGGTSEPNNAGWTKLGSYLSVGGSPAHALSTQYRIADGSEGSSMIFTYGVNTGFYSVVACIRNFRSIPEVSTGITGNSAAANPDSITPSWGNAPTLYLAGAAGRNFSADPSGYLAVGEANPGANSARIAGLSKIAGGAEDPGAFANDNISWCARTMAIRGTG
jgi:hypothetical protein